MRKIVENVIKDFDPDRSRIFEVSHFLYGLTKMLETGAAWRREKIRPT